MKKEIIIYQSKSGAIEFKGDFKKETLWASLEQITTLFGRDKSVISRHIKNIFNDKELDENSVVAFFATTAADGKTYQVEYFNLDIIISVGYRVNSATATKFRQWATKTLRQHILEGYTINKRQIAKNYDVFLRAVDDVKKLLPAGGIIKTEDVLELIKMFASTWLSLDAYDKETLPKTGATKKQVKITAANITGALSELRNELIVKKEASDLFGQERQKDNAAGIIGNIFQSFGGIDLYPTAEEKAAHLLYFMIKNHPFIDGNKRSGAFAFVWFLRQAGILDTNRLTPEALTALTLLVAESNPKDKERMVGLVLMVLKK
jgi:prophage maintenance system killer protein